MFSKLILTIALLLNISTYMNADEISEDEVRLINSMSFEELLNTEIATGVPIQQKFAPATTSILTSDEIRQSGARTLHEALEQIPGLHIYPSDVDLASSKVSIRGIQTGYSPQVLFLMDGSPLSDLFHGHLGFAFQMPTSIIHRIEVVRGAGSALHGADAFSGVINIISKKHNNIIDQVGIRYGSFNTFETWVNQSMQVDKLSIGLALSIMQSDGDNGRIVEDRGGRVDSLDTRYDSSFLHANINYEDLDLNVLIERSRDLGLGIGRVNYLDPNGYIDRTRVLTDIQHINNDLYDDTTLKTKAYFSYLDSQSNINPVNKGPNAYKHGEPNAKEYMSGISTNIIYKGLDNHTINMKLGYEYGKFDPTHWRNTGPDVVEGVLTNITDNPNAAYMLEHSRKNYYALVQDEYSITENLVLTAGVRYDKYSDFGSTINPRIALVWQESEELTLKAMYGSAFRAPSFGELYTINSIAWQGNPDLDPEIIDTYELALNYRAKLHTKLNLFYYKAKDLIDYVQDQSTTIRTAQNIKDQEGYGLELELEYALSSHISLRGNYSYQHSEDSDTDVRIANAPVHQGFVQLQYKAHKDWNTNIQYFYIGKRYRESTDSRDVLNADSIVNMTVEHKDVLQGIDAIISVRNLFDTDHKEPSSDVVKSDYAMQGLNLFAELRYRF